MKRDLVTSTQIDQVFDTLKTHLKIRIEQHGQGAFSSSHELWGVLDEEVIELKEAIQQNNPSAIEMESYDVAISAIWGIVSQLATQQKELT